MTEKKEIQVNKEIGEGRYIYAVGRRKTAHATVRLYKGQGDLTVNGKKFEEYFPTAGSRKSASLPLDITDNSKKFDVTAKVAGGGLLAQADAVKLGIARTLVELNEEYRKVLKVEDCLKRDPRMRERKKPGLRRARRAPQWSKR